MTRQEAIDDCEYRAQRTGLVWHVIGYEVDGKFQHDTVNQNGLDNFKHNSLFRAVPKARSGVLKEAVTLSGVVKELTKNMRRERSALTTPTAKGTVIGSDIYDVAKAGKFGTPTTRKNTTGLIWYAEYKDVKRAFAVLKMTDAIINELNPKTLKPC
tara:strand:- start:1448 stop:1915 length:468 start_codon:yes stop_codon:yes gene_type:complete